MPGRAGELAAGLRRGGATARLAAARALARYARTELRETPPEELSALLDEFNQHIFEMVSSSDVADKTAGVLAIVCLIGADCDSTKTRMTRFANYLRNIFPSPDVPLMELAAKTMGRLATVLDLKRAEYVEFEVRRAYEWLSEDRHEGKRHAAVLILKELAIAMPSHFYQQMSGFFQHILIVFRDPKAHIREAAGAALRAGLAVTAQRETSKHTLTQQWYLYCYEEAVKCLDDARPIRDRGVNRDDRIHGGLIILNELLRCANAVWEKKYTELMQNLDTQQELSLSDEIVFMHWLKNPLATRRGHYDSYRPPTTPLRVVTYESSTCRQLIMTKYEKICSDVMTQRLSRTSCVQQILLILIPRLAAFNKEVFIRKHLNSTMNHLLPTLRRKDKDRNMAFTSLGLLAVATESNIENYISRIMDVIKITLAAKDTPSKRKSSSDPAVFICISLLSNAVKEIISEDIKELLEPMFATGLTPALTISLKEISENIPSLKKDVSERLLNMLSQILRNRPFMPVESINLQHQISLLSISELSSESTNVVLALKTLRSFDFVSQYSLLCFVKYCMDYFLDSEQKEVRLESVRTVTKLLSDSVHKIDRSPSKTLNYLLDDVIEKLLLVAVVDPDIEVRYWVLESLNETFNMQLAQVDNLRILFISMNDEQFEIRLLAVAIIGRLSTVNPAYITPGLRKSLIQYLTEIEHSGMCRTKERAAKMLDGLILNAPRLVRPYMETILNVLVPKLNLSDSNPGVIVGVLKAIGDLADVNGESSGFDKWMPSLMTTLIGFLADTNSSEKKSVALWTFGQLIGSTGRPVEPYNDFPNLMDILLNFLKTEQHPRDRLESIRVLGLLGALDPYKHKINKGLIDCQPDSCLLPVADEQDDNTLDVTTSELLVNMSTSSLEEYYPAIVTATLMRILKDPTLMQHHTTVVQAVTFIFQSLGTKSVPYISQVVPGLLHVIRTSDANFRDFLFTQLAKLISIVKQHIRNYLDPIFGLIKEFWSPNGSLEGTMIMLVDHIAVALGPEFKAYLPTLMPHILRVLWHDTSKERIVTEKLLRTLQKFGDNLDDYMHLVLSPIVKLFEVSDCPVTVPKAAMETVCLLGDSLYYNDLILAIIHPLVRVLDTSSALRSTAMDTICALVLQLGRKYNIFIPLVQKVMTKHKIQCQRYDVLISKLQSSSTMAADEFLQDARRVKHLSNSVDTHLTSSDTGTIRKLFVSAHNLRAACAVGGRVSRDDWLEWQRQLSIGLLSESHSPSLRACVALAHNYPPVLRDLFNAAFVSCWTELDEGARAELAAALEQALMAPDAPELANTVLNLAEFMDHCDKGPLPIRSHLLGEQAMKCRAYPKALRYKEEEFRQGATSQVVEALFHINNKLQQKEAAEGLLVRVMSSRDSGLQLQVRWYEKLHNWGQALQLYSEKLQVEPEDSDSRLGQMRCLEALGEWGKLHDTTSEWWPSMGDVEQKDSARLAAVAAWGLNRWDAMKKYVSVLPEDTQDGAFFRAVIAVHAGQWDESRHYVDLARSLLDSELTAVAGESYQRAYGALVGAQLLAELEEVVTYKLVSERRDTLRHAWWIRLQGGQRSVEDWRKILQVRSLVLSPQEDAATWLKFAAMCRKSGHSQHAHSTLVMLLGSDPSEFPDQPLPTHEPQLTLEYTKNLWVTGQQQLAYDQLERFVFNAEAEDPDRCRLLARCHLKLGAWKEALKGVNETSIPQILNSFAAATQLAPDWYKAWHAWAYMNFEMVLFYKNKTNLDRPLETSIERKVTKFEFVSQHTVPAVEGFFKSINLSHGNSLQDTLRLLTLWFDYGHYPDVHEAINEGIRALEIDVWLQVIPQLIARIDNPRPLIAKLIQSLLIDIGKFHPQALVYPLTLTSKSLLVARKNAADHVLRSMCAHSEKLVAQAAMVSDELIRVAILWHEQWHKMLDEASRLYFGEGDVRGMLEALEPLHALLERGAGTLQEVSFQQTYGRDLVEAHELTVRFKETNNVRDLNQAWDLYYHVWRRINKLINQPASLELQYVSPRLLACRDLELAVPGSYTPGRELVRIAHIQSCLQIISSKQRPRRLCIRGSDGKDYMFLLKGHEDLRQDERVMQLFGLINTLLQGDPDTFRRNLAIQRYAVIPLSTNSGLIGWVPHCDTLYTLIREYRLKKKIVENLECNLIKRMTPFYDKMSLMQKVEVFEQALQFTRGDDLARLLWLKSASSEVWLERRTNFTCSLAVMSMVGYILGLGDRHPSNLMLQRGSGKLLHIDFGDCFEVAAARDKFPEKVPFRLTRMLINAMEVTGIEGTYRRTCESVMCVLHRHKDSVMAVLEAFVYDPLLNWRLMDAHRHSPTDASLCSSEHESSSPLPSRSRHATHSEVAAAPAEALNVRALAIVTRVRDKLTGRDFPGVEPTVSVSRQVDLLIKQATDNENLCQCFLGWCPFW